MLWHLCKTVETGTENNRPCEASLIFCHVGYLFINIWLVPLAPLYYPDTLENPDTCLLDIFFRTWNIFALTRIRICACSITNQRFWVRILPGTTTFFLKIVFLVCIISTKAFFCGCSEATSSRILNSLEPNRNTKPPKHTNCRLTGDYWRPSSWQNNCLSSTNLLVLHSIHRIVFRKPNFELELVKSNVKKPGKKSTAITQPLQLLSVNLYISIFTFLPKWQKKIYDASLGRPFGLPSTTSTTSFSGYSDAYSPNFAGHRRVKRSRICMRWRSGFANFSQWRNLRSPWRLLVRNVLNDHSALWIRHVRTGWVLVRVRRLGGRRHWRDNWAIQSIERSMGILNKNARTQIFHGNLRLWFPHLFGGWMYSFTKTYARTGFIQSGKSLSKQFVTSQCLKIIQKCLLSIFPTKRLILNKDWSRQTWKKPERNLSQSRNL